MARKQPTKTQHSQVRRELRTPKYRLRVVEDKTRYNRKRQKPVNVEGYRKAA
ncbi:MAG: hypothetical protein ACX931_11905 [Saccharospirillum sp.]